MPSADKPRLNDEVLSRYLLGSLPAEEAERLDELSVADDEFALRLDAVENDLVDAYVRGELSPDVLGQFQKFYLSSPQRCEKLEFAKALLRFNEQTAPATSEAISQAATLSAERSERTVHVPPSRRWFNVSRLSLQWRFGAAALAMLLATGYLFLENGRLRQQATDARNQQIALTQHSQELEGELKEQRAANSGLQNELEGLRAALPAPHALKIVAALLLPQMRGATELPTVSVPPGTDEVHLRLQLESDDFPFYQVALKDTGGSRVLWRKSGLKARAEHESRVVSINIPASLVKQQNYILELTGVLSGGGTDFISGYPVKFVRE